MGLVGHETFLLVGLDGQPSQDTKPVYLCDSVDNQDNTMVKLEATRKWTIWKTRDKEWSPDPQKAGFHVTDLGEGGRQKILSIRQVFNRCVIVWGWHDGLSFVPISLTRGSPGGCSQKIFSPSKKFFVKDGETPKCDNGTQDRVRTKKMSRLE